MPRRQAVTQTLFSAPTPLYNANKGTAALSTVRLYSDRELATKQNERQMAVVANKPDLVDVLELRIYEQTGFA